MASRYYKKVIVKNKLNFRMKESLHVKKVILMKQFAINSNVPA